MVSTKDRTKVVIKASIYDNALNKCVMAASKLRLCEKFHKV
jgi:hypothetical protein